MKNVNTNYWTWVLVILAGLIVLITLYFGEFACRSRCQDEVDPQTCLTGCWE